jgi:PD-(D/E)XK nuclease superfamily protein
MVTLIGFMISWPIQSFQRCHDVGGSNSGKRAGNFSWVYARLACLCKDSDIRSNREGGLGRNDTIIEREREAVIMEYKVRKNRDTKTIEERAKEALSQIEDKKHHVGISNEV